MKRMKWPALLLAACLLGTNAPAQAEVSRQEVLETVSSCLTEVYGYTAQEAEGFVVDITENEGQLDVSFHDKDHPTWCYTFSVDQESGEQTWGSDPFYDGKYVNYPGANSVRDGLRYAKENQVFTKWDAASRQGLLNWVTQFGNSRAAMSAVLLDDSLSAAAGVKGYFTACFGEPYTWLPATREWYQEVLAENGLTEEITSVRFTGIRTREAVSNYAMDRMVTVTEFCGETPAELSEVLSDPRLAGWTCLSGAMMVGSAEVNEAAQAKTNGPADKALLAMERGEEHLLVGLMRLGGKWTAYPLGQKALLPGREVNITCRSDKSQFLVTYPLSDQDYECFAVQLTYRNNGVLAYLSSYQQEVDGAGIRIDGINDWYHVTTWSQAGASEDRAIRNVIPYLNFVDAAAFPTTLEACEADDGVQLPEGYMLCHGCHLRAESSSHSKDLGEYNIGTLVQYLGTESGTTADWYHVRVGDREGWMSSTYVDAGGHGTPLEDTSLTVLLPVGKTQKDLELKSDASLFAPTLETLPAGTKLHILAEIGSWYHVSIPSSEPGPMMDVTGATGFLPKDSVTVGATAEQLDW